MVMEIIIAIALRILALIGIFLFSCQFLMIEPKNLWLTNQWWRNCELLAKAIAENKTRGTVGIKGRKIPIKPIANDKSPDVNQKNLIKQSPPCSSSKARLTLIASDFCFWKTSGSVIHPLIVLK